MFFSYYIFGNVIIILFKHTTCTPRFFIMKVCFLQHTWADQKFPGLVFIMKYWELGIFNTTPGGSFLYCATPVAARNLLWGTIG